MYKGKRQSFGTALRYLQTHPLTLRRYLNKYYPIYDWDGIKFFFWDNPRQAKTILMDFLKSNDEKMREVVRLFIAGDSKIVFVVGARGSGKTATAFLFAEKIHLTTHRPIFYVSPFVDKKILPEWMNLVDSLNSVPKGSFALVDESAVQYSSRDSLKEENKLLGKALAIARHRGVFIVFITQHIAMSDINIDRLKDLILWKRSNDYSFGVRGSTNTRAGKFWDKVRHMMSPRETNEVLFEYPSYRRFIHFTHGLPDCWSDELSRSWADLKMTLKKEKESAIKGKTLKEVVYV